MYDITKTQTAGVKKKTSISEYVDLVTCVSHKSVAR